MNLKTGISKEIVLGGCLLLLVLGQAEGGLVPVNGPEIFTDSHGGTWDGNNLTLMIEPSVLHNPFVQVGEDFPMRKVPIDQLDSTGNRLIPENFVGISFDLPEIPDTTGFTWQFHVAAYQGDSSTANGVIVVGTETGELARGFLDKLSGAETIDFMPLESSGPIDLSFDHEFFQSADRFFFQFKVSGATPRAEIGFSNINWITQPVPEPATIALLALGVAGVGLARRRRDPDPL